MREVLWVDNEARRAGRQYAARGVRRRFKRDRTATQAAGPRAASDRDDLDLIVHAAHAVDRTNRLLRHLLMEVGAKHAGEDDLVLAQFDTDLTTRKIRIAGKRVVGLGVKMDADV